MGNTGSSPPYGRLAAVLETHVLQAGKQWHHAYAGFGLASDAWDAQPPGRQVDVVPVEPAELRTSRRGVPTDSASTAELPTIHVDGVGVDRQVGVGDDARPV